MMRRSSWHRPTWKGVVAVIVALGVAKPAPAWPQSYQATTLEHPSPQAWASFGRSVAGVGDVNEDGVPDLLVGAPGQNLGDLGTQGGAYVISGADGTVIDSLNIPNPWQCADASDQQVPPDFGWTVAAVGDMNADGVADVAVAARHQHTESRGFCDYAGRVFLYSGANRRLMRAVPNPFPTRFDEFGISLSGIGDVNRDGVPDLLVGAPGAHLPVVPGGWLEFVGRAEVITGGVLRTLHHPEPQRLAFFGSAVAEIDDMNDDGVRDMAVGAPLQNVGGLVFAGRVYVFSGSDGALLRRVDSPNPQRTAGFGWALSAVRDLTGDGVSELIIGAPFEDVEGNLNQGRAYLFDGANGSTLRTLDNPTSQAEARFGHALADPGDVDRDGFSDLLIGAPGEFVNSVQGVAYVFGGRGADLLLTLPHAMPEPTALYGYAVSAVGDVNGDWKPDLLIGAHAQQVGSAAQQGRVFLFKSSIPWWVWVVHNGLWILIGVITVSAVWVGIRLLRPYWRIPLIVALPVVLGIGGENVSPQHRAAGVKQEGLSDSVDVGVLAIQEIPAVLDAFLQEAHKRGLGEVRVIHPGGAGIQRAVVRAFLIDHALVRRFSDNRSERKWSGTLVVLRHP